MQSQWLASVQSTRLDQTCRFGKRLSAFNGAENHPRECAGAFRDGGGLETLQGLLLSVTRITVREDHAHRYQ